MLGFQVDALLEYLFLLMIVKADEVGFEGSEGKGGRVEGIIL